MSTTNNQKHATNGVHKAALRRMGKRAPQFARIVTLVFSMFLCAAGVWANITQVPGLVRANGELTAQGSLRRVEHLHGGIVSAIAVIEGEAVKQGQVIARLSSENIDIQLEQIAARRDAIDGTIHRLRALMAALPEDPTTRSKMINDGQSHRLQKAQVALQLERRRAASALIRERAIAIRTVRNLRDTTAERLEGANDRYQQYEILASRGTISRLELNQRRDERDLLRSEFLRSEAELAAAKSRLVDAENALKELVLSEREETLTALNEAIEKRTELRHQYLELKLRQIQLDIRAPIDGVMHTIAVGVPGEVVDPGGHIADVLPTGVSLIAELHLEPEDVGQIAVGDDVALNVTTYARNRYGQVTGHVTSISPTSISERDQDPYFKVTVALDEQVIGLNGAKKPLRSGMTVQAEVVTTARSVAQYLLKPLEATLAVTMAEK